jgi:hypothetical protein
MSSTTGSSSPVETKVKAATFGAGAGAVVGQVIDYLIDMYLITPHHLDGNPVPLTAAIMLVSAAAVAWASGYAAKHTPRPDLGQN